MSPDEARTLCIDLDHTLCASESADYAAAVPVDGACDAVRQLRADGWLVVIYTARHFNHWRTTAEWLARHGVEYDQIVFGKPPARVYIDDRAISYTGNWAEIKRRLDALRAHDPMTADNDT